MRESSHHYVADPNIRVACLTCLGSIVSVQGPLLEVGYILETPKPPAQLSESSSNATNTHQVESGYHSNQSEGGITTPCLSSGCQTPSFSEQAVFGMGGQFSWLVKLCVKNISPHLLDSISDSAALSVLLPSSPRKHDSVPKAVTDMQPLPVRLESLQLLSQLAKSHFSLIR